MGHCESHSINVSESLSDIDVTAGVEMLSGLIEWFIQHMCVSLYILKISKCYMEGHTRLALKGAGHYYSKNKNSHKNVFGSLRECNFAFECRFECLFWHIEISIRFKHFTFLECLQNAFGIHYFGGKGGDEQWWAVDSVKHCEKRLPWSNVVLEDEIMSHSGINRLHAWSLLLGIWKHTDLSLTITKVQCL